jgi:NAD-dependent SIR2 family protein deacetylase
MGANMQEQIEKLRELVGASDNIVFFGGAGVSTESGIPDFRSTDGLYHQQWRYPPETILSHSFYESNPGGIFPLLPGEAAGSQREAQCGPPQAGRAGEGWES